jgi:hypothetical protein
MNHKDTKDTKVRIRIGTFVPFVSLWFNPSGLFLGLMLLSSTAHADAVRARAAHDLSCAEKSVKVQDWGAKVEARGCGRNAEYERKGAVLELAMLELEPTPEMRRQAMLDLECSSGEIEITRTFQPVTGEIVQASGCARDAAYEVKDGKAKLTSLVRPAPEDVRQKVAADLGCPPPVVEVTLLKDAEGKVTAGAKSCKDGSHQRYTLEPFKRVTQAVQPETVDLVKRAARDLGCDANKLVVSTEARQMTPGREVKSEKVTVDGCARRAVYVRKATGWELSSGPVQIQAK